jgi:hypothetical protein
VPWDLTPEQRRLLNSSQRRLVQPRPESTKPEEGRVGGVMVGDLLMLAALDDLTAQGNQVAPIMAARLREQLAIDNKIFSFGGASGANANPAERPVG